LRTLLLKHDYQRVAAKLKGTHPAPSHADKVIDLDTRLVTPDGNTTAIVLTQRIDPHLCRRAYALWSTVDGPLSNRATAIGSPSLPRLMKDGTLSGRQGVPKSVLEILEKQGVRQGVLGYLDATPDQPCHKTPLSINRPEMLDRTKSLVKRVDELYAQYMPSLHAIQRAEVKKAPRSRLWHTAFSTIYIVKQLRSAYHADRGNLRGVMSALLPMGNFTGGELVLPRWRIAIALRPGDLLLFDPQELHGNLPFEGERLSAIFYCEDRIADCGK
jgi:hypothetical protein